MVMTLRQAAQQALEALEEIALAGMSPAPEMIDNKEAFHARQAWRFIGIAARQLSSLRAALAEQPAEQEPKDIGVEQDERVFARIEAMKKRTAPQPAKPVEQEPVAWMYRACGETRFAEELSTPGMHRTESVPLYTAPQPRLIAAAPELLKAVRFLLSNPDNRISNADRNAAYAAIAKATGE